LITSLENTLVALRGESGFEVRPYAELFLLEIHRYFNVIVLSTAPEEVVQSMVNKLDPDTKCIQNIILLNSITDADVLDELRANDFLGDKTVILKSPRDAALGRTRKEIMVGAWDRSDAKDSTLKDLIPVLKNIVQLRISDVEGYLKGIREQMIVNINKGSLTPYAHVVMSETSIE